MEGSNKDLDKDSNKQLKIMEWKHNQFLGEKMSLEQFMADAENQFFLVTNTHYSNDGEYLTVSDRGGRIIIFKRYESKNKNSKLNYQFEYFAQEKDFDVHKSIEYDESVRSFQLLDVTGNDKLDILSAGFRTIKLDRIFKAKQRTFSNTNKSKLQVPQIKDVKEEFTKKTKAEYKNAHNTEINSLSLNRINQNNFISSDDFKVLLWDMEFDKEVYNVIDIESEGENVSKITTSQFSNKNPSLFSYGTNKGFLKICDLRTNSDCVNFAQSFEEEGSNLKKTIFANNLLSVHDINFNESNSYLIATRHYLSVNLWDARNYSAPCSKFLLYEPIINKLSHLYQNNYLNDKFSMSSDASGKLIITGGYNNMFHVIDIDQRLNTQITMDDTNEKLMNTNVIRKVNSKGSCFYKKDDPSLLKINFDKKICHQAFSPKENYCTFISLNCLYTYSGTDAKKAKS